MLENKAVWFTCLLTCVRTEGQKKLRDDKASLWHWLALQKNVVNKFLNRNGILIQFSPSWLLHCVSFCQLRPLVASVGPGGSGGGAASGGSQRAGVRRGLPDRRRCLHHRVGSAWSQSCWDIKWGEWWEENQLRNWFEIVGVMIFCGLPLFHLIIYLEPIFNFDSR